MEMLNTENYFWDQNLKQGHETALLMREVWPAYLSEESDIPEPALKFRISREELNRRFPVWGLRNSLTGRLVAYANAALVSIDTGAQQLPYNGWQYAIESAVTAQTSNCFCLLAANVDPQERLRGFSKLLIEEGKKRAKELGFTTMIAPVRPTLKSQYPSIDFETYVKMKDNNEEIFDPWLRLHNKMGGEILNICTSSVKVEASLEKWRQWTGLALNQSGYIKIPGGLAPLYVDVTKYRGVYLEPNVWVRYKL